MSQRDAFFYQKLLQVLHSTDKQRSELFDQFESGSVEEITDTDPSSQLMIRYGTLAPVDRIGQNKFSQVLDPRQHIADSSGNLDRSRGAATTVVKPRGTEVSQSVANEEAGLVYFQETEAEEIF